MASESGTLYIGVTNSLERRVYEHKSNRNPGFTQKYACHKLVYYEHFTDIEIAIAREKQLKKWRREKKEFLIRTMNRSWKDLSLDWYKK
jgi:putative endonuclease